ncbi:hypothetical protein ES708_17360 [subsurface metagenome]
MPWVRPIMVVYLCFIACCASTVMSSFMSSLKISAASSSCRLRAVSMTSLEVSPRWTKRDSSPRLSDTEPKKAVTSWWVSFKISPMRLRLTRASFILERSLRGMTPISAHASQTAISTRSHLSNLFSSDHTLFIRGLE